MQSACHSYIHENAYICVYICVGVCVCVCVWWWWLCVCVCVCVCMSVNTYTCIYIYMCVCVCVYVYINTHTYVYMYIYIYIYMYIHIHTETHTRQTCSHVERACLSRSRAFSTSPSSLITSPCKTFSSIKHQFYDDVPQSNLWCALFFLCCRAFLSINQVPHTHTKFSKVSSTVILHGTCSDTHTFENISPSTTSRPSAPLDHTTSRRSKPCPPLPHHPLQMWEQLVPPPSQSRDEELCITAPRCLREGLGCRV